MSFYGSGCANMLSVAAIAVFTATLLELLYTYVYRNKPKARPIDDAISSPKANIKDVYNDIVPLTDLDWRAEEPLKLRPFKPKYHLTMALENIALSELIMMDKTYLTRIRHRRELHEEQGKLVINYNASAIPAINEIYAWMTTTYLPKRFPTMFKLSSSTSEKTATLHNLVTGEDIPTTPDSDPSATLRTLSSHVDTDFLFLLPTASTSTPPPHPGPAFHASSHGASTGSPPAPAEDTPKYHLHAYAGCFPSGFNWLKKFCLPLAAIHNPHVPHYPEKLERSMDRFFATLPPGKIVGRRNWTVTMDRQLFKVDGTHGYAGETPEAEQAAAEEKKERERETLDLSQMLLRCERQTLHRLPESGALVFAFRTYVYELEEIKNEGSGPEFAEAIDGLAKGSAPKAYLYKKADVWGAKVAEYMRS